MQVGLTATTSDRQQMKLDVGGFGGRQSSQQVPAEFAAGGAAKSRPLPDFPHGVAALITVVDELSHAAPQFLVITQLLLQFRHAVRRKLLIQPRRQFSFGPRHIEGAFLKIWNARILAARHFSSLYRPIASVTVSGRNFKNPRHRMHGDASDRTLLTNVRHTDVSPSGNDRSDKWNMDAAVVEYRTFHNCDPPEILKLWHAGNLGPSAAEGFPCDILELFVFGQPFFDRNGLFVATSEDRVVGFVHAAFAPTDDGTSLDKQRGTISALLVHPQYRRQGIGRELMRLAEGYLADRGAVSVCLGAGLDGNAFYNGIYGGLQASGFANGIAPWQSFADALGYAPDIKTRILHRDLTSGRDPVSSRLIRHRRRLNLSITDRVSNLPWWWHARFGHLDALLFQLQERHDERVVAQGQILGLDVYIPKWGVRAVGLREVIVPEEHRRHGYGLSLVLEICRRLREQSIQLIEAQVDAENPGACELFTSAGFEQVQELVSFRKALVA